MLIGVPLSEIALLVAGILAGGVVTGLMAGLFGIGGGAVIVPVLYEVFRVLGVPDEVRMQLCVGTSLAIIVPTNIRSYLAHRAKGAVDHQVVKLWVAPALGGILVGSIVAAFAPAAVFRMAFVVMAGVIAFKLLFGRDSWRVADDFPGQPTMSAFGFLVGLSSSLMGVSGGSVANMIQTLYGRTIRWWSRPRRARRADLDRRDRRLCARRIATPSIDAAAIDRLRVVPGRHRDGAGVEPGRALRSAARPRAAAPPARDRLCDLSAGCVRALHREPDRVGRRSRR